MCCALLFIRDVALSIACATKRYWGYFEFFSNSRVFTPPRPVGGPEELNFARVGGGRPDLDEGRGVGTGPAVSILEDEDASGQWELRADRSSFWGAQSEGERRASQTRRGYQHYIASRPPAPHGAASSAPLERRRAVPYLGCRAVPYLGCRAVSLTCLVAP
eukprot:scaffold17258_cov119-Isochrysis_galbana.AAC.1